MADAREEEQLSLELVQDELYPALARNVALNRLMDEGGPWIRGTLTETLRGSSTTVPVTAALVNFAKQRGVRSNRAANELKTLRAELDSIVVLLGGEIDP